MRASLCGGFSCCGARTLGAPASVVVARGLYSTGSVVVVHGLSCSAVCGTFLDQGQNPCPMPWQAILNHCATREVPVYFFKNKFIYLFVYLSIYLFLATFGLRCCAQAFSSCSEQGLLFLAVCRFLIVVASCCGARALSARASVAVARGLNSSGARA